MPKFEYAEVECIRMTRTSVYATTDAKVAPREFVRDTPEDLFPSLEVLTDKRIIESFMRDDWEHYDTFVQSYITEKNGTIEFSEAWRWTLRFKRQTP